MKKPQDNFSKQANLYAKFRPDYPFEMYEHLLSLCKKKDRLWDCGTGNGQVAGVLASYFQQVEASDISQKQLDQAVSKERINYRLCRAEQTPFENTSFDLITVAQAIHWFDFEPFFKEVRRVAKPGSHLAVWGYGLLRIDEKIDELIDIFYTQTIGPFWAEERKHIDQQYESIPFPFHQIKTNHQFNITREWSLRQLEGYLNTWSAVQNYIRQHQENPVDQIIQQIKQQQLWPAQKAVSFPIFLKTALLD